MKVIYGINKIKKYPRPVVALGVFDGVHRGHRNILKAAVRRSRSIKGRSVVLTFWPHPQREESLYSLEHRLRLIKELGVDLCIVISFNKRFAKISAVQFIKNILFKKIGATEICVGNNFRFGRNAEGDVNTLKKLSSIYNYRLRVFNIIRRQNKPISSTYIRALIKKGNLGAAKRLLSRPVAVLGTVIAGMRLGKKLGFPTANIDPHHEVIPPKGIYVVCVILEGEKFYGTCYIGTKPTLNPVNKKLHIEVNIFNLDKNIYGKYLEIQFIKKIREDKRFSSLAALAKQIELDNLKARRLLSLP
ncbi:MAG: bifunctional riboflavin kinase/FAD synthetase [Candidatus Omnitrophica bacterium]|nr:bifunctional riboflavin kinase/FAD synthetase [Candidatus Omnitrophota bacterium]